LTVCPYREALAGAKKKQEQPLFFVQMGGKTLETAAVIIILLQLTTRNKIALTYSVVIAYSQFIGRAQAAPVTFKDVVTQSLSSLFLLNNHHKKQRLVVLGRPLVLPGDITEMNPITKRNEKMNVIRNKQYERDRQWIPLNFTLHSDAE
jgi:hypothetical protein